MTFKEEEEILKKEVEVKKQLDEIDTSKNLRDWFMLDKKYSWLFELAQQIRDNREIAKRKKEYEETGKCRHFFKHDYISNRSTMQDSTCVICGEKNYYMGDD